MSTGTQWSTATHSVDLGVLCVGPGLEGEEAAEIEAGSEACDQVELQ